MLAIIVLSSGTIASLLLTRGHNWGDDFALMRLLTDRDSFLATECKDLAKADYVVVANEESTYNQIPLSEVEACEGDSSLTRVFGKGSFVVRRISPQP